MKLSRVFTEAQRVETLDVVSKYFTLMSKRLAYLPHPSCTRGFLHLGLSISKN